MGIGGDGAVVDVHHLRRLDGRMLQVGLRRVERVVDLEGAGGLRQGATDVDVAGEEAGVAAAGGALPPHAVWDRSVVRLADHAVPAEDGRITPHSGGEAATA